MVPMRHYAGFKMGSGFAEFTIRLNDELGRHALIFCNDDLLARNTIRMSRAYAYGYLTVVSNIVDASALAIVNRNRRIK